MGEEQAVAVRPTSGRHVLKRYKKSCERIYRSNLVPETGGLRIVRVAYFSPRGASAHNCWYFSSTDSPALKSEVAYKLTMSTGKRKLHHGIVGLNQKGWQCQQCCEHQLHPSCKTFPLPWLHKAEGRQPSFPILGWVRGPGS